MPETAESKRQYAAVPGISIFEAGRTGRAGTGSKPAKRSAKSISTVNRSASPLSSISCRSSSLRPLAARPRIHGETVSTSITPRSRSKRYRRIMAAPPKYRFW